MRVPQVLSYRLCNAMFVWRICFSPRIWYGLWHEYLMVCMGDVLTYWLLIFKVSVHIVVKGTKVFLR